MNPSPAANPPPANLADSLGTVHVGLREDLEVTRHVFRGEAFYVIRDPMTFQSHRLTLADYEVFVQISPECSLSAIFQSLMANGKLHAEDGETFYRFVVQLHRLGFLRLPIVDSKALYERYRNRLRHRRLEKTLGFLFLRVPLWNPDAFLSRTMHVARPLFTTYAFVAWLFLVASAGYLALQRGSDLAQPINGVLVAGNLPLLAVTLILLKVMHEFGHAYACKNYGGHVPEMGAYLIMFTPCAYVDASACWGLNRRLERIVVCAAGMYVESIVAALAVFVWAATGPSLLNAIAYNVIFLAGAVTVLFNINPLMRYDGYYILSDLVDIPNLRQRSAVHLRNVLKRRLLGIRAAGESGGRRLRCILLTFGAAAGLYRALLIVAIAGILAAKLGTLGLVAGAVSIGGTLCVLIRKVLHYLWHAEETAPVRLRAVTAGLALFIALPAGVFFFPVSSSVKAAGIVAAERDVVIRPAVAGTIEAIHVDPGQMVQSGEPLIRLANDRPGEMIMEARAAIESTAIRIDAYRPTDPVRAEQEGTRLEMLHSSLTYARQEASRLSLDATVTGRVVEVVEKPDVGRYVQVGEPLGRIVSGEWRVRSILSEDQLSRSRLRVGDLIEFRSAADPATPLPAEVFSIAPAGSRIVATPALTQRGTDDVPVEAGTGAAQQPYFEVILTLPRAGAGIRYGMTGYARFPAHREPLGKALGRRILRFWDRLMQS